MDSVASESVLNTAEYHEVCGTCRDNPLWGCAIFGCDDVNGCLILCPECGRKGWTAPEEGFVPDMELAALLDAKRNPWKVA